MIDELRRELTAVGIRGSARERIIAELPAEPQEYRDPVGTWDEGH